MALACPLVGAAPAQPAVQAPDVPPKAVTAAPQLEPAAPPYVPPEDPAELLKIDPEMRAYFAGRISKRSIDRERLRELLEAILLPTGMNFRYEVSGTYDAREAFRRRCGNCVTFSVLFVAVARQFGFTAHFQNVESTTRWNRFGEIVASVQHVNVRVDTAEGSYAIDLLPDMIPQWNIEAVRVVSDERAFGQFYNTLGFFRLVSGNNQEALRYMTKATELDPTSAAAWANRASMHARFGQLAVSRSCFERSIKLEPRGVIALDGYIIVLRKLATPDDLRTAAKLERRAQTVRERNPYYHQMMADQATGRGDWPAAEKSLRRAISLKDDDPTFYEQLITTLQRLGRPDDVRKTASKLQKLRTRLAGAAAPANNGS